ncbi:MAG: peptidyl-prolyl cis-trans isomerase [Gammaproteobacteria bacterium]|nr:peptidyl-prolyl cis-trans isomerase [Gammaproteobacteria bacterium]
MNPMPLFLRTLLFATLLIGGHQNALAENPRVRMTTSMGEIVLELEADKAPATVANFLNYVKRDFYVDTIFHRVIDGFMIQGGGWTTQFERKETSAPIQNEADNGLKNALGTVAMARTGDPHSATAQFFINVNDNDFLNHTKKSSRGWGYAVFGRVVEGMDVVDKMRAVPTGARGPMRQDVPQVDIVITKMTIMETPAASDASTSKAATAGEKQ